jgi:hypothetical protein
MLSSNIYINYCLIALIYLILTCIYDLIRKKNSPLPTKRILKPNIRIRIFATTKIYNTGYHTSSTHYTALSYFLLAETITCA